jgi:hypothetical protein
MEDEPQQEADSGMIRSAEASPGRLAYLVKFHKLSGLINKDISTRSLVAARRIAADAVNSRAAQRAEVWDANNRMIFEYPGDEYP